MSNDLEECYWKIEQFANDIMCCYAKTKTKRMVGYQKTLVRQTLYDVLSRMSKHGIIAGFDPHENKIFME